MLAVGMRKQNSGDDTVALFGTNLAVAIHNRWKIDDEYHPAIAQDGSSADQVRRHGLVIECLDHEFFFSLEAVYDHPELAFAHRNHEHKDFSGTGVLARTRSTPQTDQRQDAIAQLQDFVVLHLVHVGFPGARNLRNRVQGNRIEPLFHPEQEGLDNRERKWQLQAEGRALAHPGLNFDRTLQPVHHGLHHVQADSAARDLGNLDRSAEPWPEHQRKNFGFSQPVRLFRGKEALLGSPGLDFLYVNARPVVGDFNDNLIALMIRSEMDGSARRLSASHPLLGALDAMTDGIADQMGHRLGDYVEQTLVQIGFLALHHQSHVLAALLGHVAHHPGKTPEQLLDRHHADFHDRMLQFTEHARLKSHGVGEAATQGFLGNMTGEFSERLLQHGPADN